MAMRGLARLLLVAGMVTMMGCASTQPTMAQLEAEALATGDWTAVERRERNQANAFSGVPDCPGRMVATCERFGVKQRCTCLTQAAVRSRMARGLW